MGGLLHNLEPVASGTIITPQAPLDASCSHKQQFDWRFANTSLVRGIYSSSGLVPASCRVTQTYSNLQP